MNTQQKATIYALIAIFIWSTVATAFKIALRSIHYIHLLLFVSLISVIVFFLILIVENKLKLIKILKSKDIVNSALLGILNPFIYYLFIFKSYVLLEAQIAQPLNYTWPVMLTILSIPLLKHKIPLKSIAALLISFIGVFFISSGGNILNYKISDPLGVSLALGSSIIWALFWIYNVRNKIDETVKLFLCFSFGFMYTLLFCILTKNVPAIPDFKESMVLIYIGLFEMGITFLFWMKAMQLTKTTDKISNLVYLSPFVSLIFLHFIIDENIYFTTIIGLLLIVTGIIMQRFFSVIKKKI